MKTIDFGLIRIVRKSYCEIVGHKVFLTEGKTISCKRCKMIAKTEVKKILTGEVVTYEFKDSTKGGWMCINVTSQD